MSDSMVKVIAPNIYATFGENITHVLAPPLLWAAYKGDIFIQDFSFSLMPQNMAQSIKENWVSAGGCGDDNPIEIIGLFAQVSEDKLIIFPHITGSLSVCGTHKTETINQQYSATDDNNHCDHSSMQASANDTDIIFSELHNIQQY